MNRSTSPIETVFSTRRKLRLAYFVTHPIQYQAPLLRRIAAEPDIDLKVFFASDFSVRGFVDAEFGVHLLWDTPLLAGYEFEILPTLRDVSEGEGPRLLSPINEGIKHALHEGNFDAVWVHGYHYSTMMRVIYAASSMGIPVLLRAESTMHDRHRSSLKLAVKKVFFASLKKRVSAVLAIGDENAQYWRETLGEDFPQFPCVYAVDNRYFQRACALASETRGEFRASLGLDPSRPVILFAAKLIMRKCCLDLVEAYLRLVESSTLEVIPYLVIVGDGDQRPVLEERAQHCAQGDIRFLGFKNQSELPRLYNLCDMFVLPSVDEPWGLAINEVMNAGRPVIVSDQVGCRTNLVRDGVNGYVFKAGDQAALADAMQGLLLDDGRRRAMGQASMRMIQDYSFEQNVHGLRQALHAFMPEFKSSSQKTRLIANIDANRMRLSN